MLTILEILYLVLIVFSSIIWTLLIVTLLRVIKVLWPIIEMVEFYKKIKQFFIAYKQIPEIFKEKVKEIFNKKEEK